MPTAAGAVTAAGVKAGTAAAGGALLAIAGASLAGALAMFAATREEEAKARDDEERRGLRALHRAGLAVLVAFTLVVPVVTFLAGWRSAYLASFGIYSIAVSALQALWFPRIVARRRAAERAEDPAATGGHRRDHLARLGACGLGVVLGLACLWLGVRLPLR